MSYDGWTARDDLSSKGWRLISARADSPLVASSHPGRALEQLAEKARSPRHPRVFSVPLLERGGYDFSFSGLKSNLARFLESGLLSGDAHTLTASSPSPTVNTKFSRSQLADVACAYQDTAFSHVVRQVERAFQSHHELQGVTTLAVSGGVASNAALRAKLARLSLRIVVPKPEFCVDNGIMGEEDAHALVYLPPPPSPPSIVEQLRGLAS